jgi:phage-related protein
VKRIRWVGSAKRDLVACSSDVQEVVGRELNIVQRGAEPTDGKPMPTVGAGTRELRVHVHGEFRVFYVATFPEAVYVLTSSRRRPGRPRRATSRSVNSDIDRW